jgi:putative DNA methylase
MTPHPVHRRKKLIEMAIPLEAINAASAREKSIRHGHPSTLHLWWSRKPLATARAVIFCQLVDDPSAVPEEFLSEEAQEIERLRLFALISELVQWESTTNEQVLNRARTEIRRSWRRACVDNAKHPEAAELFNPEKLPSFHDPFAGGGSLPLEAQRLGLESYASDLNPVAVLINKAMIEIPPKFAGKPPVNPDSRSNKQLIERQWKGSEGLAEDIRYYSKWIRNNAEKRIGNLYAKVIITPEMVANRSDLAPFQGEELPVVAWLRARTVNSPNPVYSHVSIPLTSTFMLCNKGGKEVYLRPVIEDDSYRFEVMIGKPLEHEAAKAGTKLARGANFKCLMSGTPIAADYIKAEGLGGRMGARMLAVVAESAKGRVYLNATREMEDLSISSIPEWQPGTLLPGDTRSHWTPPYGLTTYGDLFTIRQLVALSTLSELILLAQEQVLQDARVSSFSNSEISLRDGGQGAHAYGEALAIYLSFALDKVVDRGSTISRWDPTPTQSGVINTFSRQGIPMTWNYAESNPLGSASGSFVSSSDLVAKACCCFNNEPDGRAFQMDGMSQTLNKLKVISTDPPYYDNIGYADLSDFFYVWLRRTLSTIYPALFATVEAPKAEELIASPFRHGGKESAERFFLEGMSLAIEQLVHQTHPAFPLTIYYAFKQSETKSDSGSSSTGWETFLSAVVRAGLVISGTWPIRTELANRILSLDSNALASSVVLICHRRQDASLNLTRNEFRRQLRQELPRSLRELERANIAPVDVAQAAIGPGMAIYSNTKAVLNPDDSPMSVREALIEINAALDEYLSQDEGELDVDSRFALTFFESFGYKERDFGDAEGLAKARNLSVAGVAEAGILRSVAGKVRLLPRAELPEDWDPTSDKRLCVWEATQQLIKRLEADGEDKAAELLLQLKTISGHGDLAANCRALAYRLYNHCEKTKQAEEARAYNGLVIAWPELEKRAAATSTAAAGPQQLSMV